MPNPRPAVTPWKFVARLSVGLVLAVSVLVLAFTWPSVTSAPRDLPVAISGPAEQVATISAALGENASGLLTPVPVDGRAAAVSSIENRTVLGGIVLGTRPEVLTASAASPVVAQLLGAVANRLQDSASATAAPGASPATSVMVTDVVPLASTDARGTGIAAVVFPLVIVGLVGGLLVSFLIRGVRQRLVTVIAFSVLSGLALASVLGPWLGILQGSLLVNAAAIGLSAAAGAATIVGLSSLLGRPGIPIGAITLMLVANPISAGTMPVQFLPTPWGAVGQWFSPGAGATLLRDLSYFPSANTLFPWLVLAGWAAAGLALTLLPRPVTAPRASG